MDTHGMIFISGKFVDLNFEEKIIQEEIIIEKNDDLAILVKYTQRIYDKSFVRIDIKIYDAEQNRLNDFYQNYGFIPNTHIEILVVDEENQEFYSTDGIINDKEILEIEFYIPENSKRENFSDFPPPSQWGDIISPDKSLPELNLPLIILMISIFTIIMVQFKAQILIKRF